MFEQELNAKNSNKVKKKKTKNETFLYVVRLFDLIRTHPDDCRSNGRQIHIKNASR